VILLVALVISVLFAWTQFGNLAAFSASLTVPFIAGVLAICTFVIVLVSYFVAPLQQLRGSVALNYILISVTILMLIIETGGMQSAYISMLIIALAFAGLLGVGGAVIGVLTFSIFLIHQFLIAGLNSSQVIEFSIVGAIALIGGFLLGGRSETADTEETKEDRSYHELASQLSQMSGKSEVVINAIGDGVLALSPQGIVQLINPAAERMIGWESHDALNLDYKSVLKLLNSKDQPAEDINNPILQALNSNVPTKSDSFSIETRSGKSFLASISVSPVGQPGNGVIIVFRDITVERSDERQRAEFISTASHEMRTPVASIEGYLGLVLNPKITTIDEKARDYITKAHASAQHLGRLFADLLDVSKADDSRLKNDPKVVDVIPFIHDIVEGLTPKAVEKGLIVLYKPIPDSEDRKVELAGRRMMPVYYANVDNDHLREIVQNLVENAIKYTPKGEVTIDVGGDETHVLISVADTGIGIPKEDQSHLFQKFYRVDNSDTREIGGTGLGLYLCRRLTETIGGRMWLESEYKKGSTFFVELPRIGHDEATRLIEQASLVAERDMAFAAKTGAAPVEQPDDELQVTPQTITTPLQPTPAPIPSTRIPVTAAPTMPQTAPTPVVSTPVPPVAAPTPITAPPVSGPVTYSPEASVVAPTAQTPTAAHSPSHQENTPLAAIEADPSRYVAAKRAQPIQVSVPPR
jgi:PAS domain S-box-containing protein